jgi:hypothetical protein
VSSTLTNNTAEGVPSNQDGPYHGGTGGGVYLEGTATLTLDQSRIDSNRARGGGGTGFYIGQSGGPVNGGSGGGLSISAGRAMVTDSTISNNEAFCYDTLDGRGRGADGGGVFLSGGMVCLMNCTLAGNSLHGDTAPAILVAGGAFASTGGVASLTNCTLAGNMALGGPTPSAAAGGGLAVVYSTGGVTLSLSFCTVTGNTAASSSQGGSGGGIFLAGTATAGLDSTIVAGNTATLGPDVYGAVTSRGFNLIGETDNSTGWVATDLTGTSGSALDPVLGPLQDNGGPSAGAPGTMQVVPPTREVLPGSPALHASRTTNVPRTDERGVLRDQARPNIGAYEASLSRFQIGAPQAATAGMPFDVTVTATDLFGKTVYGYSGTVTFTSTDLAASLPANYTFTTGSPTADNGQHTFTLGVTLNTPGLQTLMVADLADPTRTGSATVTVS